MKFKYTLEVEFKDGDLLDNISYLKNFSPRYDKERAEIVAIHIEHIRDMEKIPSLEEK
jgi:hypothetical protein